MSKFFKTYHLWYTRSWASGFRSTRSHSHKTLQVMGETLGRVSFASICPLAPNRNLLLLSTLSYDDHARSHHDHTRGYIIISYFFCCLTVWECIGYYGINAGKDDV